MPRTVLITGGAGFIGSHAADLLLQDGWTVRVLDSLVDQVHDGERPEYLSADVELVRGDVRSEEDVRGALRGADAVVHLAARVGVGQSMYEIAGYTSANCTGTATLLQCLLEHPVERLVVASSMSVYGEGLYRSADGAVHVAGERSRAQLERGEWEPRGPEGEVLVPVPTPEDKPPALASIYALNKFDQERMSLLFGAAYGISTIALRFFNVYGPRQALSNPYTGVLAIFASRLLNDRPPLLFEDGHQRRDFVSVYDVARAVQLSLDVPDPAQIVLNIGSGRSASVNDVAERLAAVLGKEHIQAQRTGKYRVGDIRHCFADIARAQQVLGYIPQVELEEGMREMATWLEGQVAVDLVERATDELVARGLAL